MAITSQISGMTSSSFFWHCFVSLVKVSYWSNFYVSIITGFGVMTILFYKGLTGNSEIGNTPVSVLLNIGVLGQVQNTKYGTDVSNKMLLKIQNARVTAFTISELLRENQQGGGGKITPLPPRLGLSSTYGVTVMRANSDHALCFLSWHFWQIFSSRAVQQWALQSKGCYGLCWQYTAWKCPNTQLFLVGIQSECGKIRTRNNSVFGHSSRSGRFKTKFIETLSHLNLKSR